MTRPTFYIVRLFIVKYLRLFNHAFKLINKAKHSTCGCIGCSRRRHCGNYYFNVDSHTRGRSFQASLEARTEVVISRDNSLMTRQEVNTRRDSHNRAHTYQDFYGQANQTEEATEFRQIFSRILALPHCPLRMLSVACRQ